MIGFRQILLFMAEICTHTYVDSEFVGLGANRLGNYISLTIVQPYPSSIKVSLRVFPWVKIFQFKRRIVQLPDFSHFALSELRLFHKNMELSDQHKTIADYKLITGSQIVLETRRKMETSQKGKINPYRLFDRPEKKVMKLVHMSAHALEVGSIPTLTAEGTSGAYIIENEKGKRVSIFKPFDQEVYAPNNPRNMIGELGSDAICRGILSGQCATRQVAAYLLDSSSYSFHSVPTTTYVEFYHPSFRHNTLVASTPIVSSQQNKLNFSSTKHGSLQQFVSSIGMAGDFGSSRFSDSEIHKIGILDIRILNCDRNDANILIQQVSGNSEIQLIPIDHGLSLPDNLEIYEESIAWMNYPQAKKPFSPAELQFIKNIDPVADSNMLQEKLGFREICLRNFRIAETFLKQAASYGFSLYEIGQMIYRKECYDDEQDDNVIPKIERSQLEKVVLQAQNLYLNMLQQNGKENLGVIGEIEHESGEDTSDGSTIEPPKGLLFLKKKISLPTLKRKTTSFHERRHEARKLREGIHGVSKTVWNKYNSQKWSQLFYHYFQDLMETFLREKVRNKVKNSKGSGK